MINVNEHKHNVYSQYGEDGIIKYLLTRISRTHYVIEFGAADGTFCSNTARLWKDLRDSEALLIESNDSLFKDLESNTKNFDNVKIKHDLVYNIDDHTRRVADVCSIDVDGSDYMIAERMQTPHQIVVLEYNPTVPPHLEMIGIEGAAYGSAAKSVCAMMKRKGYTLVAMTKTNMIFLLGDHPEFESRLEVLFDYSSLNYVITAYNGEYELVGEFGYGMSRPADLRIRADGLQRRTADDDTLERLRQLTYLQSTKEQI
jgi:hypothetical protein